MWKAVLMLCAALCASAACAAPVGETFELVVHLAHDPSKMEALEAKFWDVGNPSSPGYGAFLTRDQTVEFLAADEAHVRRATEWLESLGATSVKLAASGDALTARVSEAVMKCDEEAGRCVVAGGPGSVRRLPSVPSHLQDAVEFVLRRDATASPSSSAAQKNAPPPASLRSTASGLPGAFNNGSPENQRKVYQIPANL